MLAPAQPYDLIIVGGGAAGLGTAHYLAQLGTPPGWRTLVLEREERTGGKVYSDPDTPHLDYGAAYLGPAQRRIWELVEHFAGRTIDPADPRETVVVGNYFTGRSFWQGADGTVTWGTGNYPERPQLVRLVAQIEALALALRMWLQVAGRPVSGFPGARALDALSCRDLVDALLAGETPEPYAYEIMDVAVRSAFSVEAKAMSALYLIQYSALCGGFLQFENVNGTGDSHRLAGGMSWLLDGLRRELLDTPGNELRTGVRVERVDPDADGVTVTLTGGEVLRAQRVVVAISPFLLHWPGHPHLPPRARIEGEYCTPEQRGLAARMVPGLTRKVFLRYDTAWWRVAGLSGYGLSHSGPIDWFMDNCQMDGDRVVDAVLMAFIVAGQVVPFDAMSPEEQVAALNAQVKAIFGAAAPDAREVRVSPIPNMHCPAAVFPPGALTGSPADLAAPVGNVYFAASELGRDWPGGYVNGALDSARTTAQRIATDLWFGGLALPAPTPEPERRAPPPAAGLFQGLDADAPLADVLARLAGLVPPPATAARVRERLGVWDGDEG